MYTVTLLLLALLEVLQLDCGLCQNHSLLREAVGVENVEDMIVKNHEFVFIGGVHFSGTSVTERILSSQYFSSGIRADLYQTANVSACRYADPSDSNKCHVPQNEGGFVTWEFEKLNSWIRPECTAIPFYEWGRCARVLHYTEKDIPLVPGGAIEFRNRFLNDMSVFWNISRQYLVMKDIPNLTRSRFLQELLGRDKTHFIFTLRHPLGSCKLFHCNITGQIEAWISAYSVLAEDVIYLKNYLVLYEEYYYRNASSIVSNMQKVLQSPPIHYHEKNGIETKVHRKLFFNGEVLSSEDYNVTIENTPPNMNWYKIYPSKMKQFEPLLSPYERRLNKFCYSIYSLYPICLRSYWKTSISRNGIPS